MTSTSKIRVLADGRVVPTTIEGRVVDAATLRVPSAVYAAVKTARRSLMSPHSIELEGDDAVIVAQELAIADAIIRAVEPRDPALDGADGEEAYEAAAAAFASTQANALNVARVIASEGRAFAAVHLAARAAVRAAAGSDEAALHTVLRRVAGA